MENNFVKLDSPKINKKHSKEKYLKENIFQELTIYNNLKEDDIQTKITNIKSEELNDLKLIDIRLIHLNSLSQQNLETNGNNSPKIVKSFNNNVKKKRKKEIKIFPYISFSKKNKQKYKSADNKNKEIIDNNKIRNNEERKLFMTKIENMKKFNDFNIKTNKYKSIKDHNLNHTCHKNNNDSSKFINNNYYLQTEYDLGNNEILNNLKYKNNNSQPKCFSNINENNNQNNKVTDIDKDDIDIYNLLRKNKQLKEFLKNKKRRIKINGNYIRNSILSKVNERNNTFNKQIINEKQKRQSIENKLSVDYKNIVNLTQQREYKENQKKIINFNILKKNNINRHDMQSRNQIIKALNLKYNITSSNNNDLNETNDLDIHKLIKNKTLLKSIINCIQEMNIKVNLLKDLRNKEKLKRLLYIIKVNNLEQSLNKDFEKTNNKFKTTNSLIIKMKKKCKDILEDLDKKINFNLEEFIKEYEKKDLGINFVEFFNYLLIILVNYDKKIIPNTFTIKKETNKVQEDIKYSSVLKRHIEFMNILDKQYNEGKNADKLLRKFILKREEEIENDNPRKINKKYIFNK